MTKVKIISNNKGFAMLESVALAVVFVVMIAYGVGMFGVIHSGTLNSIAARTYAWETFNHRANVTFFRDNRTSDAVKQHYANYGFRVHAVTTEKSMDRQLYATSRNIAMFRDNEVLNNEASYHVALTDANAIREFREVNPVWIKTLYGICLDSTCGTGRKADEVCSQNSCGEIEL